jgi:(1->4)-alpha-D-glucan 1-alpha-D-glucosylmutase
MPVYRTYVTARGASAEDVALIDAVCAKAAARLGGESADALAFVRRLMRGEGGQADFAIRLQQVTGPLMAKSLEDTAFYRWIPLLALNEVGGEPGGELPSIETFHRDNRQRLEQWPHAMLTTATHDTKRGEDARARLAALSYVPDDFADAVARWWALHQPLRRRLGDGDAPHPKDAWLFYQALFGAWPLTLSPDDGPGLAKLRLRLQQYLEKALREAKERSRWTDVNAEYEAALSDFVAAALEPGCSGKFLSEVRSLVDATTSASAANALAQLLFKLTAPGVPDIYQGTGWWDFSLVDPDNRRAVDFAWREEALDEAVGRALDLEQGSAKLQVIQSVLALRRVDPELFARGDYRALDIRGPAAEAVVAYARTHDSRALIVCAKRYGRARPDVMEGSEICLEDAAARLEWNDVFGARRLPAQAALALSTVFGSLPIALLYAQGPGT